MNHTYLAVLAVARFALLAASLACAGGSPSSSPPQALQPVSEEMPPQLEPWQLGPAEWPTTCEAAALDVTQWLSPETREKLRATPREDLILFHHGLGTGIRNRQGLWRGNAPLIKSCLGAPGHPDDASMVILEKAWLLLHAPR